MNHRPDTATTFDAFSITARWTTVLRFEPTFYLIEVHRCPLSGLPLSVQRDLEATVDDRRLNGHTPTTRFLR
jgi:hypothetical protein